MYEHLRNDSNEFSFPDNVKLYCDPSFGIRQSEESKLSDFFQLPQRLGWNFQENGDRSLDSGTADLNDVTQRWLYFEVLAQVFGHLPDYRSYDFVKTDLSGTNYIRTTHLPKYLEQWLDSEKKSQPNERKSRLIRIQQVLDKARWYVSQHCAVPSRKDTATWEINDLLALSFIILGETLTRALSIVQKKLGFRIEGWCSHDIRRQGWGYSKLILQKLDEDGWCAKAIHMLQAQLRGKRIFGGIRYVEILNRVWISRAENPETVRQWSDKHREGHHEAMSAGERLPPTTKWCVDGPSHPDLETMKTEEEAKPTDSKDGHISDEEEIKPLRRSQTTGFRNRMKGWLPGPQSYKGGR